MVFKKEYYFRTNGNFDIVNITDHVIKAVNEAGMREGMILIFSPSSTSAITTTEYENGCIADLREW